MQTQESYGFIIFFLLLPFIFFAICGLISGIINGNSLTVTILGTFDYLKYFFVIFIYGAFFNNYSDFKKIFNILLVIAVLLGAIALLQFVWAMGSVYILKKEITDPSVYIFMKRSSYDADSLKDTVWRFGLFRTPSLTYGKYILGLYALLFINIYLHVSKKTRLAVIIPLFSGVIASVTRMAYGGLLFVLTIQFIKKRKWAMLIFMIILLGGIVIINFDDLKARIVSLSNETKIYNMDTDDIRLYTGTKAMEVWKDNPFWGVGPGFFGGTVASKYHSFVYEEYNVHKLTYLASVSGIEQFWYQILAEAGIIGAVCFGGLFIMLFLVLDNLERQSMIKERQGLFSSLKVFLGCILIYSLGTSINITPVLFTYCAFVGIGLGSFNEGIKGGGMG